MSDPEFHLRSNLAAQVMQFSPTDAYHEGATLDDDTYFAAMDRVIKLLEGKINNWTDLKPEEDE